MKNHYFFLELTKKYKKGFGDQTHTLISHQYLMFLSCKPFKSFEFFRLITCLLYYPLVLEAQTLVGSPQT